MFSRANRHTRATLLYSVAIKTATLSKMSIYIILFFANKLKLKITRQLNTKVKNVRLPPPCKKEDNILHSVPWLMTYKGL